MVTLSSSGKQALDSFIKETSNVPGTPAFILGVSNIDDEIYFQGGGNNIIGDSDSGDINPESVFWICSQTKMVTALAALKLLDQGKITLETPVSQYFPQFSNPVILNDIANPKSGFHPAQTVVTFKHLLNYSSGLFYPASKPGNHDLDEAYTSAEFSVSEDPVSEFFRIIIGDLPGIPLKFEPGTDWVYGWSSDILGFLVEKISGQTLENFLKEHIFTPLGMKSSYYLTPDLRDKLVDLSVRDSDGNLSPWKDQIKIIERDPKKVRIHFGGAAMYSSMRDYLTLLRHLLQIEAGRQVENPILKRETVHSTFTPVLTEKGAKTMSEFMMTEGLQWGTAQGISTKDTPGGRKKGSAFWGGWAGTMHFLDPATGLAAVFGTQVCPPGDMTALKVWIQLESLIYSGVESGAESQ